MPAIFFPATRLRALTLAPWRAAVGSVTVHLPPCFGSEFRDFFVRALHPRFAELPASYVHDESTDARARSNLAGVGCESATGLLSARKSLVKVDI